MNIRFDDNLKQRCLRSGSVLVMVVVLTVLLALIGVLFVVMARMDNMSASGVANNADLHAGVEAVVDQIKSVMVEDLFGTIPVPPAARVTITEMQDSSADDLWLASLEPIQTSGIGTPNDESDDEFQWPYLSQVYGALPAGRADVIAIADPAANSFEVDADGDGVSDSRWIIIPGMKSTKGKDIYAAVRIIDNCAMLNLNTAHSKDSSTEASYLAEASYLSAVDYEKFLREDDRDPLNLDNIRIARNRSGLPGIAKDHHDNVVMHIENPGPNYSLFDIGDELEIRNRYMLTSFTISRFERKGNTTVVPVILPVAYETFDGDRGYQVGDPGYTNDVSGTGKVKRIPYDDITKWMKKINPDYFDASLGDITKNWSYDRRHVCTFYSFDRNLRRRDYPLVDVIGDIISPPPAVPTPWTIGVPPLNIKDYSLLTPIMAQNPTLAEIALGKVDQDFFIPANGSAAGINDITSNTLESRKKILHLLYAIRAYYIDNDPIVGTGQEIVKDAARRAAQYVANMIDYADDVSAAPDGPFGAPNYGNQKNDNITYINRSVIRQLILEVSGDLIDIDLPVIGVNPYEFGLGLDDVANGFDETVYGYERQPFISELASTISTGNVIAFGIELCNPYDTDIDLTGWRVVVGPDGYSIANYGTVPAGSVTGLSYRVIDSANHTGMLASIITASATVKLQRPDPANSGQFITVDETQTAQTRTLTRGNGIRSSMRDDTFWKFIDSLSYRFVPGSSNLGSANGITINNAKSFQLPVANDPALLSTLHGLEGVTVLGNVGPDPDPINNPVSNPVTQQIGQMAPGALEGDFRFDIEKDDTLLEYISLTSRLNGRLPGRININTATKNVIRAAIPENSPWAIDADTLTNDIVTYRNTTAFTKIGDLLNVPGFRDFEDNTIPDNVGDAAFTDDIEERDWILSRLANIFTVRSDTFTAYILVRLGVDGPQKRMIAILDRTGVSSPSDRPRLVALHPVPDPR